MTRVLPVPVFALLLLPLPACQPLPLAAIPPVCARPEVLAFLGDELRKADAYEEILPDTVTERPAPPGNRSACTAYARHLAFDTLRTGPVPAVGVRPLFYTVHEASGGGLVVDMAPGMPLAGGVPR